MNLSKNEILSKTNYGLNIYAFILRHYSPSETVLRVSGLEPVLTKNPFTKNGSTLSIIKIDNAYHFNDSIDKSIKGDPFSFAELHYKLKGDDLLKQIIKDLNLYGTAMSQQANPFFKDSTVTNIPMFSYYKSPISNIFPLESKSLLDIYYLITSTNFKKSTQELRNIKDKTIARKFKANNFDYVTFSGIFNRRTEKSLIKHSNLLTIDFDHIENISDLKRKLIEDPLLETELLFISPSGDGLKWVISIDTSAHTHQEYFLGVSNYLEQTYQIDIDKSGKDISRACFLPFDAHAFINPKYREDEK